MISNNTNKEKKTFVKFLLYTLFFLVYIKTMQSNQQLLLTETLVNQFDQYNIITEIQEQDSENLSLPEEIQENQLDQNNIILELQHENNDSTLSEEETEIAEEEIIDEEVYQANQYYIMPNLQQQENDDEQLSVTDIETEEDENQVYQYNIQNHQIQDIQIQNIPQQDYDKYPLLDIKQKCFKILTMLYVIKDLDPRLQKIISNLLKKNKISNDQFVYISDIIFLNKIEIQYNYFLDKYNAVNINLEERKKILKLYKLLKLENLNQNLKDNLEEIPKIFDKNIHNIEENFMENITGNIPEVYKRDTNIVQNQCLIINHYLRQVIESGLDDTKIKLFLSKHLNLKNVNIRDQESILTLFSVCNVNELPPYQVFNLGDYGNYFFFLSMIKYQNIKDYNQNTFCYLTDQITREQFWILKKKINFFYKRLYIEKHKENIYHIYIDWIISFSREYIKIYKVIVTFATFVLISLGPIYLYS
jgi:hypothetical protein